MKAKVSRGTDLKISRGGDLTISRGGDLTISRGADLIRSALVLVALTLSTSVVGHDGRAFAQAAASKTKADVTALASDRMEGRLTGTAGERAAGDYIISELRRIGAKPLPGNTDYRLPFEFTAGAHDGGSFVGVTQKPKITQGPRGPVVGGVNSQFRRTDVQALSFSDDAMVQGPLVFAGYGIVVPESQDFGYDSYATLDVKDKIVLVLRYFPEDADAKTKGVLSRYADLRYKALAARQRGAKALLVVTGPHSPNAGELVPMTFDTALGGSGIAAESISAKVADALFEDPDIRWTKRSTHWIRGIRTSPASTFQP